MHRFRSVTAALLGATLVLGTAPAHAATTVVTMKGSGGQTLTTSQAKNLSLSGQYVTVSGRRYDETVGIYVAMCVLNGAGKEPTPCGGGIDKSGTGGASEWVSSNPPPYGVGLAVPFSIGGSFKVRLKVGPFIGSFDCRKVKCAIVTKADHLNQDNRSADVFIPVTFAIKKNK